VGKGKGLGEEIEIGWERRRVDGELVWKGGKGMGKGKRGGKGEGDRGIESGRIRAAREGTVLGNLGGIILGKGGREIRRRLARVNVCLFIH
jgi:hypothetical protein